MGTRRLLAGIEHSLTLTNEAAPFHVVCVLRMEGPLDEKMLRGALAVLQRKHPLLRARIVQERGGFYFDFDNTSPVPVTVQERKPGNWITVAEDELNRRLEISTAPLLRCTLLKDSGGHESACELILSVSHTILDASSALTFIRELLTALAGGAADLGTEIVSEGKNPATALFPKRLSGAGYSVALMSYMARQMADEAAYRWRARGTRKPAIKEDGRNRILPVQLSKTLTDALIRATRRERVTMNSILSAAMMLAAKRHLYPSKDTPLRNITFADLRPYLGAPVPDGVLGCFMGMCRYTLQVKDNHDFWVLAHDVHDAVYRSNRRGERFIANAMSPGMMKMILKMRTMRMGSTALSYAGPMTIGDSACPVRLHGVHAFTSNLNLGPEFSSLARMFLGEIWLDYLYLDSDLNEEKARQIADEIRHILEKAVSVPASQT